MAMEAQSSASGSTSQAMLEGEQQEDTKLTPELLFHVLAHLSRRCIPALRLVSSQFRNLCDDVGVHTAAPKCDAACLARFPSLACLTLRWPRAAEREQLTSLLRQLRRLDALAAPSKPATAAAFDALMDVPAAAVRLTRLEVCGMTDARAELLHNLAGLQALMVCEWNSTGTGLQHVVALTALHTLGLTHSVIPDSAFQQLPRLPHLASLDLSGCLMLGDGALHWAASLGSGLTQLRLAHACEEATAAGVLALAQLSGLRALDLSSACDNAGGGSLARLLAALPGLQRIELASSELLSAATFAQLPRLSQLSHLCVLGAPYPSLTGLGQLSALQQLQHLDCSWNSSLRDHDLAAALAASPPLRALNLAYCRQLGVQSLGALAALAPHLTSLNLMRCWSGVGAPGGGAMASGSGATAIGTSPPMAAGSWVPGAAQVQAALHGLSALRQLRELKVCGELWDLGWVGQLTALTHLTLRRCHLPNRYVTGWRSLSALVRLESLYLSHSRLEGADLALAAALPRLETLSLACCASLGDDQLAVLCSASRLAWLDLRHCGALTGAGVAALLAALPAAHCLYCDAAVAGGEDPRLVSCVHNEVPLMV